MVSLSLAFACNNISRYNSPPQERGTLDIQQQYTAIDEESCLPHAVSSQRLIEVNVAFYRWEGVLWRGRLLYRLHLV